MTTRSMELLAATPRSIPTAEGLGQKEIPKPHLERLRDECQLTNLVLGYSGIDLLAPGLNAAGQVLYLEAGLLQEFRRFLAAAARLAMDYDLAALVQLAHALLQVPKRNQVAADLRDFEFMRFAYIEQKEILARVALLLERGSRRSARCR